tara:strand:- start:277 stop:2145 length:1869 start_codon:yes stop_codon:yes gene_type:complete
MNPVTKSVSPDINKDAFLAQTGIQEKINSIANKLGVSVDELLYAIGKETAGSYSSSQRNLGDGKAVGLIQFYPDKDQTYKTIAGKKYEISDLEQMSELEQLDIVDAYLTQNFKNKGGKPGELYVSIAYPSLVGASPETELTPEQYAIVSEQNPGWVKNGKITKASISSFGSKPEYSDNLSFSIENLNPAQKDLYNKLKKSIDASGFPAKRRNELAEAAYQKALNLDSRNLQNVKESEKYTIQNLISEVNKKGFADDKKALESYINDPSISTEKRLEAENILKMYESGRQKVIPGKLDNPARMQEGFDQIEKYESEIRRFANENINISEEPVVKKQVVETPTKVEEPEEKVEPTTSENKLVDSITTEGLLYDGQGSEIDLSSLPSEVPLTEVPLTEEPKNTGLKNTIEKIKNSADEAFFALSAGAGIMSIFEATRRDKVTKAHVSPLFKEALLKTREASQVGMPYEQQQAALKDINNAYAGAIKNVMAISGGQRGAALANIGAVDASRVNSLVDLASKSADIRQKNLDLYSKTAAAYSQQKLSADMSHESLKQKVEMNRKNNIKDIGLNLFKEATEYSRNYMDLSAFDTDEETTTNLIPTDDVGTQVVYDELGNNLGFITPNE